MVSVCTRACVMCGACYSCVMCGACYSCVMCGACYSCVMCGACYCISTGSFMQSEGAEQLLHVLQEC